MGNDMFNDEQLAHAEIVQKETEEALGFWKERALKAEAKLADKYLIEEQYETACGDRDGLLRMVETLREQKTALEAERDALLSRPVPPSFTHWSGSATHPDAPPADAATEAVREAAEWVANDMRYRAPEQAAGLYRAVWLAHLDAALSSPAPAPSAKETRT